MTSGEPGHKETIQREFALQAAAFDANPVIRNQDRVTRLVEAVSPDPESHVLDVACGPGHVALGFAAVCRDVVGLDLTPEMLAKAERNRQESGYINLLFQPGDADQLPFPDGAFDVVVCRFAFHHVDDPSRMLAESSDCAIPRIWQPSRSAGSCRSSAIQVSNWWISG